MDVWSCVFSVLTALAHEWTYVDLLVGWCIVTGGIIPFDKNQI